MAGFNDYLNFASLGLLGSKPNPAKEANKYLSQVPEAVKPYYEPYAEQGMQAYQQAGTQYDKLVNDPQGFFNEIMAGYKPSTGYDYKANKLMQTAQNAAAAGGFAGTEADQRQQAELINSLLGEDMYQYINSIMGLYGTGLQGLQNMGNTGYQASTGYGDIIGNTLGSQASLGYQGAAQNLSDQRGLQSALIKALPQLIPLML